MQRREELRMRGSKEARRRKIISCKEGDKDRGKRWSDKKVMKIKKGETGALVRKVSMREERRS